jgi:hypothetical protein
MGFAVYNYEDVDSAFLLPIKVNISSISAALTSSGIGVLGRVSVRSVVHTATVRDSTFKWLTIRRRLPPSEDISLFHSLREYLTGIVRQLR